MKRADYWGSTIVYEGLCAQEIYRRQLLDLLENGREVKVRGRKTLELLNVVTVIHEPTRRPIMVPGRRASPFVALSEILWLLAGSNELAPLLPYNRRMRQFSDDGKTLYGAYGYRIWPQLEPLIARLRKEREDRRAVLSIWRWEDLTAQTKDPPCNDMVLFKLRGGELHTTVICRSNDIHWGLYAVNVHQFSALAEYVATRLGVKVGTQTHVSNSLHLYLDKPWETITDGMLRELGKPLPPPPDPEPLFPTGLPRPYEFRSDAYSALVEDYYGDDGEPFGGGVPFFEFANDVLRSYRRRVWQTPRHADLWRSWEAWAKEYLGVST